MSSFSQKQAQETGMAISFIVFAIIFIKGSYDLLPVGLHYFRNVPFLAIWI